MKRTCVSSYHEMNEKKINFTDNDFVFFELFIEKINVEWERLSNLIP